MFCCFKSRKIDHDPGIETLTIGKQAMQSSADKEEVVVFENKSDNRFLKYFKNIEETILSNLEDKLIYADTFVASIGAIEDSEVILLPDICKLLIPYKINLGDEVIKLVPKYNEEKNCIEYKFDDYYYSFACNYNKIAVPNILTEAIKFYYDEDKLEHETDLDFKDTKFAASTMHDKKINFKLSVSKVNAKLILKKTNKPIRIFQISDNLSCERCISEIEILYQFGEIKVKYIFNMKDKTYADAIKSTNCNNAQILAQTLILCHDDKRIINGEEFHNFQSLICIYINYLDKHNIMELIRNNIYIIGEKMYINKEVSYDTINDNLLNIDIKHFDKKTMQIYINCLCKYAVEKMIDDHHKKVKETHITIKNKNQKVLNIIFEIMKKGGMCFKVIKTQTYYDIIFFNEDNSEILGRIRSDSTDSVSSVSSIKPLLFM